MAQQPQPKTQTVTEAILARNYIKPGSKEHEAQLELAYGMNKAKAEQIIKERASNPALWPYEMYEKAQAFLSALAAVPVPVDKVPGWKRSLTED